MQVNRIFSLLSLFILTSINLSAQNNQNRNEACNPTFARALVEQQVSESKMVEETDKRINILLRSADFLWKHDEPTARKFFKEAFETADTRFKEKGFETKKLNESKGNTATIRLPDYRTEVIAAIAKKDVEWAKRLSEQVLLALEKDLENRKGSDNREIHALLKIASENAAVNPALSLYLFRRVMRYPLDHHWYWTLYTLAKDNKTIADSLYLELLQNYQNETPRRLLFLSAYPFAGERIFGMDKYQYGGLVPSNLTPNRDFQARFLNAFFLRAASFANNPDEINRSAEEYRFPESAYILTALQDIEPIVTQNFPNLLERFSAAKAQANSLINEQLSRDIEKNKKAYSNSSSTFAEKMERIKKADAEGTLRDYDIISLVFNLDKEEYFAEAESWLIKIKDDAARKETENYFYFKRSQTAIKDKRFDEAKKYALAVEELEHRAILYFELANERLKTMNELSAVSDILSEVSATARKADDSVEKAQVLLGLASAYEKVNHQIALGEIGEAVKTINRLDNPDIFSVAVFRKIIGKDFGFYSVFNTPGYNLETAFTEISKNDFEIALAHARNLNDKYFRTLAVIAVVKNCVETGKTPVKPAQKKSADQPKRAS